MNANISDAAPLTLAGVRKSYGKLAALKDAHLRVEQGEIFGLIGLNGAGKTTLIKIILDLLRPDRGEARFFGVRTTRTESRKKVVYLPEKFNPGRLLKGKEFLDIQLAFHGKTPDLERTKEACAALDLPHDALNMRVGKYSKGMGQKLGLIATLLSEAKLLILDEPMSGLDPKARALLKRALLNARAKGTTIFFSSHILADVSEICERIAVLHEGNLLYTGSPAECMIRSQASSLEDAFLRVIGVE